MRIKISPGQIRAIRLVDEAAAEDGTVDAIRLCELKAGVVDLDDALVARLVDSTLPEVIDRCGDWGFEGAPYVQAAKTLLGKLERKGDHGMTTTKPAESMTRKELLEALHRMNPFAGYDSGAWRRVSTDSLRDALRRWRGLKEE